MSRNRLGRTLIFAVIALAMITLTACGTGVRIPDEYNYDDFTRFLKLGQYKNITYTQAPVQVTQQEIIDYIDTRRADSSTVNKLKTGVVTADSVINVDYVGKIDGVAFDGGTGSDVQIDMKNNNYIDGFASGMIGHKAGETFDINVTFPANYGAAELAGKPAVFTITINYIEQKILPEYNDQFVKDNTEYNSMKEYEDAVREKLLKQKEKEQKDADMLAVFNKIIESSELIKLPDKEYKLRYDAYVNSTKAQAEQNDVEFEKYVAQVLGVSMDEYYKQAEKYATEVVTQELVLHSIARKEDINITNSDYDKYVQGLLEEAGYTVKSYEQANGISIAEYANTNNLYSALLYRTVMKKVMKYSVQQ